MPIPPGKACFNQLFIKTSTIGQDYLTYRPAITVSSFPINRYRLAKSQFRSFLLRLFAERLNFLRAVNSREPYLFRFPIVEDGYGIAGNGREQVFNYPSRAAQLK